MDTNTRAVDEVPENATAHEVPFVRLADALDVVFLCELVEEFIIESGLEFTYNYGKAYDLLLDTIDNKKVFILLCDGKYEIEGVAILQFESTFYDENVAYLHTFYVRPKYRGTKVARMLVDNMVQITENVGAKYFYTSSTAAISSRVDKLFGNLFKKFGFKELGPVFSRRFD